MEFLIATLSTIIASAVCAVVNEAAPEVANEIVRRAAGRIHADIRESILEEWLADLDRRSSSIAKLRAALTLYWSASELPQTDYSEPTFAVAAGASIDQAGKIKIVLRRFRETHEYELTGDPARAVEMLRRNGHEEAADALDSFLQRYDNE